jgi:D-aminopeptidase
MQEPRRARELGVVVGALPTGPLNAITDIDGVRVGHVTIDEGDIHTGVTSIVPEQILTRPSLPAGLYVGNGYGKLVGSTQITELGEIETPIVLTATLSAFRAADALITYMLALPGRERLRSVNPVVGETNDGYLSDIRARPVTEKHVLDALRGTGRRVEEGCVGAGAGTSALGFKAGIGTSSRLVPNSRGPAGVGVLVQANFSGVLRVCGVPVPADSLGSTPDPDEEAGNSCMIVVATDARLDGRQLARLARRAVFAMGRVGSDFAGGSGDYALAFATPEPDSAPLPESDLDAMFAAVLEATEEALLNSLFTARTTVGVMGRVRYAVAHDRLLSLLRTHGVDLSG